MRFSLRSGFLYIKVNTCVSKLLQFGCKGRRIGFMRPSKPLVGVGGVYTRFALGFVCLTPLLPPPPIFYLILV